jgi:hypothetical protein
MAIFRKTNPIGKDHPIDRLQLYLYNNTSFANHDSHHRAYKNIKGKNDDSLVPERYDVDGEYKDLYYNDNLNVLSFFLSSDEVTNNEDRAYLTDLSIIYEVNLKELYPTITHRADEEFVNDILYWIDRSNFGFKIESITTGVNNVYSGLNTVLPKLDDIGKRFVVRFNLSLENIDYSCRTNKAATAPTCADVNIVDSLSALLGTESAGGTFIVTDSVVSNSDDTYLVNVQATQALELPDITHTDSNLSPVTLPAQTAMVCTPTVAQSGIAYQRPAPTGQTTIYIVGDDGWQAVNGTYDYVPPVYPLYTQRLDFSTADYNAFAMLVHNNTFGHKFRLSGKTGGYWDFNTLNYKDSSGTITTLALAFPDDYIIDHYTGLGWFAIQQGNPTLLKLDIAISTTTASTAASFSDWRVPARHEIMSIIRATDSDNTGSTRMNYDPFADLNAAAGIVQNREHWTTTNVSNSATLAYRINASAVLTATNTGTFSRGYYMVRNHFN